MTTAARPEAAGTTAFSGPSSGPFSGPSSAPVAADATAAMVAAIDAGGRAFGLLGPDDPLPVGSGIATLRRRRRRTADDPLGTLTLVDRDGVLAWEQGAPSGGERRLGARAAGGATTVTQYRFRKVAADDLGARLVALDALLSPAPGLRRLDPGSWTWEATGTVPQDGRALLLLPGTFGTVAGAFGDLVAREAGRALLGRALAAYPEGILAYEHATLSVSPLLNAIDLQRLWAGSACAVDVVAHGRGALVARWWLEGLRPPPPPGVEPPRALLAGAPLAGTSLATPARLVAAMSLLTSYGRALGAVHGSVPMPLAVVPAVLLQLVASVAPLGAATPGSEVVAAMIPGLAAQSAARRNAELARLRAETGAVLPAYHLVRSTFESDEAPWRFWRRFHAGATGMDRVFDGGSDLVVDAASMTALGEGQLAGARALDLGANARVHHASYFADAEVLAFVERALELAR